MKLRNLSKEEKANVAMIGAAIGILITLIISILIFYNIAGSIDVATLDAKAGLAGTPTMDAMNGTMNNAATFFTIGPIVVIVIVAVVVIGYVKSIG